MTRCPRCEGRGTVEKTYDEYGIADPKDVPCVVCHGLGLVQPADQRSNPKIKTNDIVQIDPTYDKTFGACLMVVTEVKTWGVQGFVKIPGSGDAYYRVPFENCAKVGTVEWAQEILVDG